MPAIKTHKVARVGKKEYVLLPRREYKALERDARLKRELDAELDEALEEVRLGKTIGPFETVDELIKFLEDREQSQKK